MLLPTLTSLRPHGDTRLRADNQQGAILVQKVVGCLPETKK